MKKPRCTCQLAYGPAEGIPAELHDDDCLLYLAALAAEEVRQRFMTLARGRTDEVAEGASDGSWTTEND